MKNKKMPIVAIALLAIVGVVGGTIAYFTSVKEFPNIFKTDVYKTEIEEFFNPEDGEDWKPGSTVDKAIHVTNTGNVPVAVRIEMEESWYEINADGSRGAKVEKTGKIKVDGKDEDVVIKNLNKEYAANWIIKDNVYYYNKALAKGESIQHLESVTLNNELANTNNLCKTTYSYKTSEDGKVTYVDSLEEIPAGATKVSEKEVCSSDSNGYSGLEYELKITVSTVQYDAYKDFFKVTDVEIDPVA